MAFEFETNTMGLFHHKDVRIAAASGRFYPHEPARLRELLASLWPTQPQGKTGLVKALIAPHAGYIYSGPVAATAFAQLAPDAAVIRRIVLVGPAHFVPFEGIAVPTASAMETPLGRVPIDTDSVRQLLELPEVLALDQAHAPEHSLEVELPFLQSLLKDFSVVPLLIGKAKADTISMVLDFLWGGPETRIIVSSDLSHYLDGDTARALDSETARAITRLEPDAVTGERACGWRGVQGLLRCASEHGLKPSLLDLRNSGDTAGTRSQVVGYGAFMFVEANPRWKPPRL